MKIRISRAGPTPNKQKGFTYLILLAAVIIVGIGAQVATDTASRAARSDREAELIFRGLAYKHAIKSYYEARIAEKTFPGNLEDLLKDPRFPKMRHIRNLYADPMAQDNNTAWTLIRSGDGGISGVASQSRDEPLKKANFPLGLESLEGAASYSEWVFEFRPKKEAPKKL